MTQDAPHQDPTAEHAAFTKALHAQRVWDTELPGFDTADAPASPLPLFHRWFLDAVAAGQSEPHTMTLATVDADGRPDLRTLMLHEADAQGWHFASHATSAKGRQLAERPEAALHFYWPALGRQIRLRGPVTPASAAESRADLAVRTRGALAAALTGHQSEVLPDRATLLAAADAAWDLAGADPEAPAPTWTRYTLAPREAEFFQGDPTRRHTRLHYTRTPGDTWTTRLLWP
ncbi:pyridoxal 5'-phosphate synthase [Streptomyces sp. NPDC097619]|uniref:pyridoxine/pyridoxamine 5'-phosphate oxidase n=1 Tax=Streptomyces sp. NPDC097619 TaxID=3157228 RepID=UPI003324A8A8